MAMQAVQLAYDFDTRICTLLSPFDGQHEPAIRTAVQLIAIERVQATSSLSTIRYTLISDKCTRGTPFHTTIFPCFAGQ